MSLKIGTLADRGGVNLETIRYYERERLLPSRLRLPSGYRLFPESTVQRVRFMDWRRKHAHLECLSIHMLLGSPYHYAKHVKRILNP